MFGEDYFKTRKRLSDVVQRVVELAKETGAEDELLTKKGVISEVNNPFLFVVCGEVNAGKSSMLNGLVGQGMCNTNVLPETDRVRLYRYGKDDRDKALNPHLTECFRSVDFLMNFNLVDTPGINSSVKGNQSITHRFFPVSDLIFWVFSASNPWSASTWDLISKQDEEMLGKSICVIQQSDLHDKKDLEILLDHIRDLSEKRIGKVLPIYPISGMLALKAKRENLQSDTVWRDSGYTALEQHISNVVRSSSARREVLVRVIDAVGAVLRNIEDMIELRSRLLRENEGFLREIELEVDEERRKHSSNFGVNFTGIRKVFVSQGDQIVMLMYRKMNTFWSIKSLFAGENLPKEIEMSLIDSLQSALEQQASDHGVNLIDACRAHWETIRPRVMERLTLKLKGFNDESGGFSDAHERFVKSIRRGARQAVVNLKIRGGLDMKLTQRRDYLKSWLYVCLLLLLAAGVTGSLNIAPYPYLPLALLAGSATGLAAFAFRARATRNEIIAVFNEKLHDAQLGFADSLANDYRAGIRNFYIEYGGMLEGVRRQIANAKIEQQPNHEQWNVLFFELKEIEHEL